MLHIDHRSIAPKHDAPAKLLRAWPRLRDAVEPVIIAVERLKDRHPTTSSDRKGGTSITPSFISARKKRDSLPFAKSISCSIQRSEEHTSELQSLMRISYAVFCLKKKNTKYNTNTN